jgi:hypothetical protein
MRLPIAIIASCFAAACAPSAESVARSRAANEFQCPESSVTTRELSHGTEVVNACGHQAVYTCPRDRHDRVCIREAPSAEIGSAAILSAAIR